MNKLQDFLADADLVLDAIGGETLSGSGFETEIPEPEFVSLDFEPQGTGR